MTRTPESLTILNIHRGFDTGGQGHRITDAFRRLAPDWPIHSAYRPDAFQYLNYPADRKWDARTLQRLYDQADVVHLHNGFATAKIFEKMQKPKPAVVHYHGTKFRQNPKAYLQQQRRRNAVGIVSTLDLLLLSPDELVWCPSPYDLEWLRAFRGVHQSRP